MKCSKKPRENLGNGVIIERRYIDGELGCIAWWHSCNGVQKEDSIAPFPFWKDGWKIISENPLTVSPSVLCKICGFHGFIRSGKWERI